MPQSDLTIAMKKVSGFLYNHKVDLSNAHDPKDVCDGLVNTLKSSEFDFDNTNDDQVEPTFREWLVQLIAHINLLRAQPKIPKPNVVKQADAALAEHEHSMKQRTAAIRKASSARTKLGKKAVLRRAPGIARQSTASIQKMVNDLENRRRKAKQTYHKTTRDMVHKFRTSLPMRTTFGLLRAFVPREEWNEFNEVENEITSFIEMALETQ